MDQFLLEWIIIILQFFFLFFFFEEKWLVHNGIGTRDYHVSDELQMTLSLALKGTLW